MASTIKVDKIEGSTGSTVTVPTGQSLVVTDGIGIASIPTITVAKGGTNTTSYTTGDTVYASGATAISKLGIGTARQGLQTNSGASAPEWVDSPQSLMTAQGDILYASGANTLAKLAKGSGSDTLKMNSGATAPEWVTVAAASSDFVNLASGAAVSGSELSVDGFYTSDYNVYKLYLTELSQTVDSSVDLYVRVNEGGTAQTDSNYMYAGGKATRVSGSGGFGGAATGWNEARWSFTGEGVGVNYPAQGEVTIHDPLGTNANKQVEFSLTFQRWDNGMYNAEWGGGFYRSTTASTGLTFYMSTNNITVAHWALYGLKAT
jgi:hypothetical protein